jgi:putative ABC transport system permease protein
MIRHFFTNTWRRLLNGRLYSVTNLAGLSVGMAGFILIAVWMNNEFSYNTFHSNYNRIARVTQNQTLSDGKVSTFDSSPVPLAQTLKSDFPEVESTARVLLNIHALIGTEKDAYFENGGYADQTLFSIFSFGINPSIGSPIFQDDHSIVISHTLASKLFGNVDPLGKTVTYNNGDEYKITAIFDDVPENSSYKFDFILPFDVFIKNNPQSGQWGYSVALTFVLLQDAQSFTTLSNKIKPLAKDHVPGSPIDFFLYPLSKIHLYGKFKNGESAGGRIDTIKLIGGIAILILLMAIINFINLSTAIASTRSKEVGVRKVVGAGQQQLIQQFIGETLLLTFAASVIAWGIVYLILPYFNGLFDLALTMDVANPIIALILVSTVLFTGLAAGAYPAFVMAAFQPARVLQATMKSFNQTILRKSLIVIQLLLSTVLIVSTTIIHKQIQFIKNKELGFSKENIIRFRARGDVLSKYESFKTEALRNPAILQMTSTDSAPIGLRSSTTGFSWPGKQEGQDVLVNMAYVNYDFIETLGMNLLDGRSFNKTSLGDSMAIIVNEAAVAAMGLSNPIGTILNSGSYNFNIIGTIKNHHASSLHNDFTPFVFMLSPTNANLVMARIAAGKSEEAVTALKALYKEFEPTYPFEFTFLDDVFMKLYQAEMRISTLATWFSGLAIMISCLGLLGLSAYSANRRRKEIAVRKVLGAPIAKIMLMLNLEYFKLLGLAILLALPFSFYASSLILDGYAFRVAINEGWILLSSGLILLTICILTVSYYSLKAASTNPAETLKYE